MSSFLEIVERVRRFLERNGRVSLRALKREFDLDDESLDEVVEELVDVQQVAAREGKILTWLASSAAEAVSAEPATEPTPRAADVRARPPEPAVHPTEAEHRQLTVMFCDLVGSTELSERLDAEDLSDVVTAYQKICAEGIESFDGHIAQYLGDGVLVYFGYPLAHEDDAVRAIHAALRIVDEIPLLNMRLAEAHAALRERPLQVRIGIHTGPVIVGELGDGEKRERLALGDTVNIASRLEAEAEPGSIVVSGPTRHLMRGAFVFESLGERSLKGIEEPMALFRPVQATGVLSRLELAGASGLTPLIGREQQVGLLLESWEEAKAGHGQVVLLSGEAGMGKSRLIEVLREHVADEHHTWHEYRGSAYHQNSAFYPVIELIERALVVTENDTPEERVGKLARGLGYSGFPTDAVLPLIAELLGLPLPENLPPLGLSPEAQRKRTLEILSVWSVALSQRQPIIMIGEDMHWWDPSSLEVAARLIAQVPAAPILIVATFRPEFEPPWPSSSHLMHLPLQPLTQKQTGEMVTSLSGGKQLPLKVREQIVAKTDGVPLFVEELAKSVLESGLVAESDERYERTDPLPDLAIPTTLRDSLAARLDRLGPAKEVAQLAAVLGREFSHELLRVISPLDPPSLDRALGELVGAGLLYQRGIPPLATYIFKHALIQDAALQSLLKKRRREYNALVAKALEEHFPGRAAAEPEVLARYYEEGGLTEQALSAYERAGESAHGQVANEEAIQHLRRGLQLLEALPSESVRAEREVNLQLVLARALTAARGYAHPETIRALERAREIADLGTDTATKVGVHYAMGNALLSGGNPAAALSQFELVLGLAGERGDEFSAIASHYGIGAASWLLGRCAASCEHLERAVALYQPDRHRFREAGFHEDPGIFAYCWQGWALWYAGFPERAVQASARGIKAAKRLGDPYSLVLALAWAGTTEMLRRDMSRARALGDETVRLASEQGFPFLEAIGRMVRSWVEGLEAGDPDAARRYGEAIAQAAETGNQGGAPQILQWLAEIHFAQGRCEDTAASVDAALAVAQQTGQVLRDADLHRLRGELFLTMDAHTEQEAEQEFQHALEVARSQGTCSLELRAATSLARLWQRQGKHHEALSLLAPIYDWFTEGFDTQDLKDAKALLDELS